MGRCFSSPSIFRSVCATSKKEDMKLLERDRVHMGHSIRDRLSLKKRKKSITFASETIRKFHESFQIVLIPLVSVLSLQMLAIQLFYLHIFYPIACTAQVPSTSPYNPTAWIIAYYCQSRPGSGRPRLSRWQNVAESSSNGSGNLCERKHIVISNHHRDHLSLETGRQKRKESYY